MSDEKQYRSIERNIANPAAAPASVGTTKSTKSISHHLLVEDCFEK